MTTHGTPGHSKLHKCVHFGVMFGSRILDNGSADFEKVYCFEKGDSNGSFSVALDIVYFLNPKTGLNWSCRRLRIKQMAIFVLLLRSSSTSELMHERLKQFSDK